MVWRWLVGGWLRSQASQKVQEAVFEAIHEQTAARDARTDRQDQVAPADVGVVFALRIEAGGLIDRLSGVVKLRGAGFVAYEGGLAGRRVVAVVSGPGGRRAQRATEALLAGHKPAWVISAGFAGGLAAGLDRGDVVVADSVADAAGRRLAIDVRLDAMPGVRVGRVVSVARIVRSPDEKLELGRRHEALAVDLESYSVAEVCRREKVRFLALRAISDPLDERLPRDLEHLMNQQTVSGRLGAVSGAIFRRPASVKDIWKLRENALLASDRLAKLLAQLIPQLTQEQRTDEPTRLPPPRE